MRWDTETKFTLKLTWAVVISFTDRWWGGDASACDAGLEGATLSVVATAVGDLADIVDADRTGDEAVAVISAEEPRDTATRSAGLLGAAVLVALTRGRHT